MFEYGKTIQYSAVKIFCGATFFFSLHDLSTFLYRLIVNLAYGFHIILDAMQALNSIMRDLNASSRNQRNAC